MKDIELVGVSFKMMKLKDETITRLTLAYKNYLQQITNEISTKDLYGNESISKDDFEEIEDLMPLVWYSREKWNKNPNNYWLIQSNGEDFGVTFTRNNKQLLETTVNFMYMVPIE